MPAGRPPIFETPEAMEKAIEEYFATPGQKITITGLAYHLGFCDRQSLYDYEEREEFSCIVKRARLRVEMKYEERLSEQACTGAIFALKNMKWVDKSEVDNNVNVTNLDGMSTADLKKLEELLSKANGR